MYDGRVRGGLVICVLLAGCGAAPPRQDARATVRGLATSLRARDAARLAELLDRPQPAVEAAVGDAPEQLAVLADRAEAAPLEEHARVYLASGERVLLVREDGAWRIDRGLLGVPALASPADAVRAFHDALARARWADLAAVLASGPRAELEDEARRWLEGTRDVDALDVSVEGDTAIVRTPTGGTIDLVREGGEWRVVELR